MNAARTFFLSLSALIAVTLFMSATGLAHDCSDTVIDCQPTIAGVVGTAIGIGVAVGAGALGFGSAQGSTGGTGGQQKYGSPSTAASGAGRAAKGCAVFPIAIFGNFFREVFRVAGIVVGGLVEGARGLVAAGRDFFRDISRRP